MNNVFEFLAGLALMLAHFLLAVASIVVGLFILALTFAPVIWLLVWILD